MAPRPALSASAEPVVEASLRLFRRVGYHGTTVREIAREAGMNVAAMYHYFRSKEELLYHIMRQAMEDNLGMVEDAAASSQVPAEEIAAMISAVIEYHTAHPAEAFIGNSELRSLEGDKLEHVISLRDREENLYTEVIERGVAEGSFVAEEAKQSARAIISMCSAVATWYQPGGRLDPATLKQRYVSMGLRLLGYESTLPNP
ncbi:TetR family transcriptional regulator [Rhodococcus opacus]|uniref:TetR family transcriptional regulator n=1 Tax=Rhodococcus opacus TaxID=37919 RepID=UPI001C455509|nr:TetR family transcriptional regulator [Rhodococcus opacus]MBV6760239.1 TetR/AcrR family transcriptional regulator [Rhodococcus opacus]